MSDYIDALPIDEEPLDPQQQKLFNDMVGTNGSIHRLLQDLRGTIFSTILFFLLNLEMTDTIIENTVSYAKTTKTSLLFVKTFIFMIGIFVINNIHLF
ncbi:hypothetical protein OAV62_01885 [bacterium]|nr:hypothetical protein [bacterium]